MNILYRTKVSKINVYVAIIYTYFMYICDVPGENKYTIFFTGKIFNPGNLPGFPRGS